jgi:hypothetical protein
LHELSEVAENLGPMIDQRINKFDRGGAKKAQIKRRETFLGIILFNGYNGPSINQQC